MGPTGAHTGGVGTHPYGDRGPYGHKRPGQPLEAEAEVPGEISPSSLPTTAFNCIDYPALSTTPPHPTQALTDPFHIIPSVSSTCASDTTTFPLFPVLICPCVFCISL